MLANYLCLFGVVWRRIGGLRVKKPKCREFLIIWAFEFVEELEARRVKGRANIEGRSVERSMAGLNDGRKTTLALTFVLLSTHFNHNKASHNIHTIDHSRISTPNKYHSFINTQKLSKPTP